MFPDKQFRFVLSLLGLKTERDKKRCMFTLISGSMLPLVILMQSLVYWRWYYRYERTLSFDCLFRFAFCMVIDIMILWSHRQAKRDPGFVAQLQIPLNSNQEQSCKKCNALKTQLVHHCSTCDKCVFLMDHHCWWTNNCIGYNTFKPFFLFSLYVGLLSVFGVITIVQQLNSVNIEHKEGLQGVIGILAQILNPKVVFTMVTTLTVEYPMAYLDVLILQISAILGGMAVLMTGGLLFHVSKNESQVDAAKKLEAQITARRQGKPFPLHVPYPRRTLV